MKADVDRIAADVDIQELERLLGNITAASLRKDELSRYGDETFLKLFKLSQMSIDYLMYTQNYLEMLTQYLSMQYKNAHESTKGVREKILKYNNELSTLRHERDLKEQTLRTYAYLLQVPKEGDHSKAVKCPRCSKFFASADFLKKHYAKKHPEADFAADFPSQEILEK